MAGRSDNIDFDPLAWLGEPGLRMVSLQARGLWIDCLCVMWQCDERGVLAMPDGSPMPATHLARIVGTTPGEVESCIAELLQSGVASRDDRGRVVSRRMVRLTPQRPAPTAIDYSTIHAPIFGGGDAKPVFSFACHGTTPRFDVDEAMLKQWEAAFPTLDVMAELRKAEAWLAANRRKTARGMPRFIVGWLSRATDYRRAQHGVAQRASVAERAKTLRSLLVDHDGR